MKKAQNDLPENNSPKGRSLQGKQGKESLQEGGENFSFWNSHWTLKLFYLATIGSWAFWSRVLLFGLIMGAVITLTRGL